LPINTSDKKWNNFNVMLERYSKIKKHTRDGNEVGIKVIYRQSNKFGRYTVKGGIGLQHTPKEIKKYISGEYYIDVDIVNCHPVILNKLLKDENDLGYSSLNDYVNDRDSCLEKWNVSKMDILKMINEDKEPTNRFFKVIHRQVYSLVDELIKKNKQLFAAIKNRRTKAGKTYNFKGAFLSAYLQNIENDMLQIIFKQLSNKGFTVGVLMYDGLMVEILKDRDTTTNDLNNVFKDIERMILDNLGYEVRLQIKSMETNWRPNIIQENEKVIAPCDC
jgi:hypothetical protein